MDRSDVGKRCLIKVKRDEKYDKFENLGCTIFDVLNHRNEVVIEWPKNKTDGTKPELDYIDTNLVKVIDYK